MSIDALREAIVANGPSNLAWGGFLIGLAFGFIVYRTNFCTMGSLSDILTFSDWRRFRAWLLAAAVALLGAQLLHYWGIVDLGNSIFLFGSLSWGANLLGGVLFGFGMAFAGGCASRNLVRAGSGDMRSLIVLLVVGIFSYMTLFGLLALARNEILASGSTSLERLAEMSGISGITSWDLGTLLAVPFGAGAETGRLIVTLILAGLFAVFCFASKSFRTSPVNIIAGVGIGLCVIAGWALTGLAFDEFADTPMRPTSLSYVRPTADTVEWMQRFTAAMIPQFGVATVLGAIAGAFAAALSMGKFKLAAFADAGDMGRNLFGAALMGVGGTLAFGCTIGQAVTGVSTLALGSFIAFGGIIIGGIIGIKALERIAA